MLALVARASGFMFDLVYFFAFGGLLSLASLVDNVRGRSFTMRVCARIRPELFCLTHRLEAHHSRVSKRGAQGEHDGWSPALEEVGLGHSASVQNCAV